MTELSYYKRIVSDPQIESLRATITTLSRRNRELEEALRQVLGWIDSWETSFDDDPEWLETRHHVNSALSATMKSPQPLSD